MKYCKFIFVCMAVAATVSVNAGEILNSFKPGEVWPDNDGVHINAHGGGILHHGDAYYWFGQHMVAGREGNKAQVGVSVYSSKDLYNWENRGVALEVLSDPQSDITKGCILERPKVIYNKKTNKFVMWFHLELKGERYKSARYGVATADCITGPYTFLHSKRAHAGKWPLNAPDGKIQIPSDLEKYSPDRRQIATDNILARDFEGGQMSRDQTLFVDTDGRAYHIFSSEENSTTHIALLNEEYTDHSGTYTRVFPFRWMEAPAIFKYNRKYYFLGSGCSGWKPNAARSAVADTILGPWTELGNPCVGTNPQNGLGPEKTFGGQSTYVLPVAGKDDSFIAMFDVWQPKDAIKGGYVWLPITFTENGFQIIWLDEWNLSYFQNEAVRNCRNDIYLEKPGSGAEYSGSVLQRN